MTLERSIGGWGVVSEWRPAGQYPHEEVTTKAASHHDAYLQGRSLACCRGALSVRVVAPDGTVAHDWRRGDNIWRDHVAVPEERMR